MKNRITALEESLAAAVAEANDNYDAADEVRAELQSRAAAAFEILKSAKKEMQ
jgi:hypothetical protein